MYDHVQSYDMTQLFLKTKTAGYYMTLSLNQFLYSQALDNAAWSATNMTRTSGQTDPDAGTDAYTLTATAANATLKQSVTLTGTLNRVISLYLKRKTGTGNISLTVDGSTYEVVTITGSWVRYDVTLSASGTVTTGIKITTSGDEVYAAWAMLEDGNAPSTYDETAGSRYQMFQISDADYPANTTRGCAFLDGRFFVMATNGDIYQSDLENAASWAALDFIGSQVEPDEGVYLAKHQSYIVSLKMWSTEFFYDAANATGSILSPVQNAFFKIGCASEDSVKEMADTIVWMGQTRDGYGRGIFRLTGTAPQKISTPQIDKILNADSLATVYSWSTNVGSHMLYGITLVASSVTLVYDFTSQQWSFFTYLASSGVNKTVTAITATGEVTATAHGYSDGDIVLIASTNGDFNGWHVVTDVDTNTFQIQATGTVFSGSGTATKHTETYFPISASTASNGKQYMQHATTGTLYEFSESTYTDPIGAIAARIRTPKIDGQTANYKVMRQAEIIGDKISSVAVMRYSDDDYVTYSSFRPVDLSVTRSRIRRLGNFNRRAFEILHVKNALMRLEAIEVEGA